MTIPAANANFILQAFAARLGDPYAYGCTWSPTDASQGCDCSGCVGTVLEALTKGQAGMNWDHDVSTESWPFDYDTNTPAAPGTVGPYGTIAIATAADAPADAALIINIMHGGGGEDSHMSCYLPATGTYMESNGSHGTCTGSDAYPNDSSIWTDHWVLPGPIEGVVTPVTAPPTTLYGPDLSNNNWSSTAEVAGWLDECFHREGFSWMEHKVSEGDYYADPYWPTVRDWCAANSVPCIGYHYVTTDDPNAQAAKFVGNGGGTNAMFDFEANSGNMTNFWAVVNAFNAAGVNVAVSYIPHWYWQQIGSPDLSAVPGLISSSYGTEGTYASTEYALDGGNTGAGWVGYGGATPVIWQFADAAIIDGKSVDANAYNGTLEQLTSLLGGGGNTDNEGWNDMSSPTPQDVFNMFNGTNTDGSPLVGPDGADYRRVDLLAPDTESLDEGPNTTRSVFDQITTLSKILTKTHNGKTLFQMIADLHDKLAAS